MESLHKLLMAMLFAMAAVVLYCAVITTTRSGSLLSVPSHEQTEPERILSLLVLLGSAKVHSTFASILPNESVDLKGRGAKVVLMARELHAD